MATVYYSTDASAPTLSGTAGTLIAVLDACLVNGYGSKSSAGWAKSYSGTNLAAYRAPSGNRFYLRIDDSGTFDARVVAYESMSNINTGTNPFPTSGQITGGGYWRKSATANATARPWIVVADTSYLYIYTDVNAGTVQPLTFFFGDLVSYKSGDGFGTLIYVNTAASNTTNLTAVSNSFTTLAGHYLARATDQTTLSQTCGKHCDSRGGSGSIGSNTSIAYPHDADSALWLGAVCINEGSSTPWIIRGEMPGLLEPMGNPGATLDTFTGSGSLAGVTYLILTGYTSAKIALRIS